jgi:hypothetical protein
MGYKLWIFLFIICLTFAPQIADNKSLNQREKHLIFSVPEVVKTYQPATFGSADLDSLQKHYGENKEIPEKYRLPILLALSHYPELQEEQIVFKLSQSDFPMVARPKVGNLITHKKENRRYIVLISENEGNKHPEQWLKNLHLNAQVGLLGHELGHIVQYSEMSKFKVMKTAFNYLFQSKREAFEKDADKLAIEHGLGWQVYDWANTIRAHDDLLSSRRYINRFYLTPGRIKGYMWELGYYEPDKPESQMLE